MLGLDGIHMLNASMHDAGAIYPIHAGAHVSQGRNVSSMAWMEAAIGAGWGPVSQRVGASGGPVELGILQVGFCLRTCVLARKLVCVINLSAISMYALPFR